MIEGEKALGLITARGGSKEVPRKNIHPVGGKPLIVWTIEAGLASRRLDRLILSSEDDAIIAVARAHGCEAPFRRAIRLAADDTPSMDVVFDALDRCPGYEWIILLQPTSPLRTSTDIDAAIQRCVSLHAPACVSVCEAEQSPHWMYFLRDNIHLSPVMAVPAIQRRQDLPAAYLLNGAIYLARVDWLRKKKTFVSEETVAFRMPPDRSADIDSLDDFKKVEARLAERRTCNE